MTLKLPPEKEIIIRESKKTAYEVQKTSLRMVDDRPREIQ